MSTFGIFYFSLFDFQLGLLKSNRKTIVDFRGFRTLLIKTPKPNWFIIRVLDNWFPVYIYIYISRIQEVVNNGFEGIGLRTAHVLCTCGCSSERAGSWKCACCMRMWARRSDTWARGWFAHVSMCVRVRVLPMCGLYGYSCIHNIHNIYIYKYIIYNVVSTST